MALTNEEYSRAIATGVIPGNASAEDRANIGLTREALARQKRGEEQRNMANWIEPLDLRQERVLRGLSSRQEESARGAGGGGREPSSPPPAPRPDIEPSFAPTEDFQVNTELTERNFGVSRTAGGRFDISKFRSEITYNNLPTHSFLVQFARMNWMSSRFIRENGNPEELLTLRCENAIMPTVSMLQFDNLRRYGYGPIENTPYGYNMGDFTLQFLVDKNAAVIKFFEDWNNFIIDRKSFGGANMIGDTPNRSPYELKFKDEFACPVVTVFVYDRSQNNIFEYNMYDVYPNTIQSMNLSWSDENQLMRLNVGFAFTDMQIKTTEAAENATAPVSLAALDAAENRLNQDLQQQVQNNIAKIQGLNTSVPETLNGVVDTINQPIAIGTGSPTVTTEITNEDSVSVVTETEVRDGQISETTSWEVTSSERTTQTFESGGSRTITVPETPRVYNTDAYAGLKA